MQFSAAQIAQLIEGEVVGDASVLVSSFGRIEEAKAGELTFLANPKYENFLYTTQASIVLVRQDLEPTSSVTATLIRVEDPYASLARLMQLVQEQTAHRPEGIHPSAVVAEGALLGEHVYIGAGVVIEEGASIGNNCQIYPNSYIGRSVKIGAETIIYPNVTVYYGCVIGKGCILHAGAVVGADGFGFAPQLDGYHKIPQLGNVIIGDEVELGANTCVDRAVMGSTIIEQGCKIDNLVQIAHNCRISAHTVLAAQVGIAGSTTVGSWCQLGGQVGLAGHLKIGDRVQMAGQTGVLGNIESDRSVFGSPAMDSGKAMRVYALQSKLPELYQRISQLEKELKNIKLK